MVQGHDLKGEVGDALQQVFAESEGEFSLCCSFDLDHLISLADFGLEDVNDALILFMDVLDIAFSLMLDRVFVAFLIGEPKLSRKSTSSKGRRLSSSNFSGTPNPFADRVPSPASSHSYSQQTPSKPSS